MFRLLATSGAVFTVATFLIVLTSCEPSGNRTSEKKTATAEKTGVSVPASTTLDGPPAPSVLRTTEPPVAQAPVPAAAVELAAAPAQPPAPAPAAASSSSSSSSSSSTTVPSPSGGMQQLVKEELESLDPTKDGWLVESLAQKAEAQLAKLAAPVARGNALTVDDVKPLIAGEFKCESLRPGKVTETRRGAFLLRRPESPLTGTPNRSHSGADGLVKAFGEFAKDSGRFDFKVVLIDGAASQLTTEVLVESVSRNATRSVQQTATWKCSWMRAYGTGEPLLLSIDLEAYEEVTLETPQGRLFADCTEAALSKNNSYGEQLLYGQEYWARSLPVMWGLDLQSHSGIALGDVNGDGLDDIYVCQPGGLPNRLFVHEKDGTVVDRSAAAGIDFYEASRSALIIDLDNDGDQDLVVAFLNVIVIFANDGAGKFTMKAEIPAELVYSITAADYDNDGNLDVFASAYSREPPVPYQDASNGADNLLIRNKGNFEFEEMTDAIGLARYKWRFTISSVWEDFDNDGDVDLYAVNDHGRNCFYRNDGPEKGKEQFVGIAKDNGSEDVGAGRGVTVADCNRDGKMDFYISRLFTAPGSRISHKDKFLTDVIMETRQQFHRYAAGNSLYFGSADGTKFEDVSEASGAMRAGWAHDSKFVDFDNDGWEDLLVVNGNQTNENTADLDSFYWRQFVARCPMKGVDPEFSKGYMKAWMGMTHRLADGDSFCGRERNRSFLNLGDGTFADVSGAAGFDFADDGRSMGLVDWDFDGDVDVWVANRTAPRLRFLRNDSPVGRHFVSVLLEGRTCNRDAIGARVELHVPGSATPLLRTLRAGEGFLAQSSKWLYFGLGDAAGVTKLVVKWPDGKSQEFSGLKVDQQYKIIQNEAEAKVWQGPQAPPLVVSEPKVPAQTPVDRVMFPARVPMVDVDYKDFDGKSITFDQLNSAVLINLWASHSASSVENLRELAKNSARFKEAGLHVLALSVDAVGDPSADLTGAKGVAERLPFVTGSAADGFVDRLELLVSGLITDHRRFPLGTSLLVDPDGWLAILYRAPVSADQILADARLASGPAEDYVKSSYPPLAGTWRRPPVAPTIASGALSWVGTMFDFAGLKQDAARYWLAYQQYFDKVPYPAGDEDAIDRWKSALAGILSQDAQKALFRLERKPDAIESILAALELKPDWIGLRVSLANFFREKEFELRLAEEQFRLGSDLKRPLGRLAQKRRAWILCCNDKDPDVIDGPTALGLAEEVASFTERGDFGALDVLAACYAEVGEWDKAVATAEEAFKGATKRNAGTLARHIKGRLELFRQKKKFRGMGGIKD